MLFKSDQKIVLTLQGVNFLVLLLVGVSADIFSTVKIIWTALMQSEDPPFL